MSWPSWHRSRCAGVVAVSLVKDALAASSNRDDLDGIDAAALAAAIHSYRSAALLGVEVTGTRATS